jgi:hypothetical protein
VLLRKNEEFDEFVQIVKQNLEFEPVDTNSLLFNTHLSSEQSLLSKPSSQKMIKGLRDYWVVLFYLVLVQKLLIAANDKGWLSYEFFMAPYTYCETVTLESI